MNSRLVFILFLLLLCTALAGCSFGSKKGADDGFASTTQSKPKDTTKPAPNGDIPDKPTTVPKKVITKVKIMYWNEKRFEEDYGKYIIDKFPNYDIQVVPMESIFSQSSVTTVSDALANMVSEQKPDIIFIPGEGYSKLSVDGKLLDLENWIQNDYDADKIAPFVMDNLRLNRGGRIYGLAPSFYSQAIYYNKDMFDKYAVPYPHDQMSWDDLMNIADQFTLHDTKTSGFFIQYFNKDYFNSILYMANTAGMSLFDYDHMKFTFDNDSWIHLFELVKKNIKLGAIYEEPVDKDGHMIPISSDTIDPFVQGNAAMTLQSAAYIGYLSGPGNVVPSAVKFQWDLVIAPVDPLHPGENIAAVAAPIYSINAQSNVQQAAWDIIKFINSDEFAYNLAGRPFQQQYLPSRLKYLNIIGNGHNMAAFYNFKSRDTSKSGEIQKITSPILQQNSEKIAKYMMMFMNNSMSSKDTLKKIQDDAQRVLDNSVPAAK